MKYSLDIAIQWKQFLKIFAKFIEKQLQWNFATFLEKELNFRCFPVNSATSFRARCFTK